MPKNDGSDYILPECLKVQASEFVSSARSTIDEVQQVISIISKFTYVFGVFRLSNSISDCLDLLDLSADEPNWTLLLRIPMVGLCHLSLFLFYLPTFLAKARERY
ncbi:unnamed protein product [Ilex paraguariensis]|uniref:Uncharacterized protein n=1 Tax=Ilex paraguariensis TaxID=185542 RepID=A0ABC8RBA5_9AQUA